MEIIIYLLIFQGFLGGFDVFWNHEWQVRLPSQPWAALEQKIHGLRELLYACLFLNLAWFQSQGNWIWLPVLLIAVETILTAWDFVQEDRSRILSPVERVTHLILSMTGGAYVALLIPVLWDWHGLPNGLQTVHYGLPSYCLSLLSIGVFVWGLRDLLAGLRLQRNATQAKSSAQIMQKMHNQAHCIIPE